MGVVDAFDAGAPLVAKRLERTVHLVERLRPGTDETMAVHGPFGDEARVFEDGDVALHGREGHWVGGGKIGHRVLALHGAGDDVAAGRVGQRAETPVEVI